MSMPKIECTKIDKCCAAASLLQSIALEETALSHIINAEGEKLQKAINQCHPTSHELIEVNSSVESMIDKITSLEIVLKAKLDFIAPLLEECPEHHRDCDE